MPILSAHLVRIFVFLHVNIHLFPYIYNVQHIGYSGYNQEY